MAKATRKLVKLKSTESNDVRWTEKNQQTVERLELKKFDRHLRRHVVFKESK